MNITINGKELAKSFIFSDGAVQIRLPELDESEKYIVKTRIDSSNKLMELMLVGDALNEMSGVDTSTSIIADISYLPYARQDRVCYPGESEAVSVIERMLLGSFDKIFIDDFHSSTYKLSESFINTSQCDIITDGFIGILDNVDYLIAPDKGASKKVEAAGKIFNIPVICVDKIRNPNNGYLEYNSESMEHLIEVNMKNVLILDDICDGGMTFRLLAEELSKYNPLSISLFVTHGIFSNGTTALHDSGIGEINCKNNFLTGDYS